MTDPIFMGLGADEVGMMADTDFPGHRFSRHIPDDVKREVWDRDGGQCVRCGASEYLEFDHIIPHARGGANTTKNVQLLCRGCNGEKSDRI